MRHVTSVTLWHETITRDISWLSPTSCHVVMNIRPGLDLPHHRHQHPHLLQGHHDEKHAYTTVREIKLESYGPAKVHLDAEISSDNDCDTSRGMSTICSNFKPVQLSSCHLMGR